MSLIVMYTTPGCPYCMMAKHLLTDKGQTWTEIDVEADPGRRVEMRERSGRTAGPQIRIGDRYLGGFDELADLERRGELDGLLGTSHRDEGTVPTRVLIAFFFNDT